MAHWPDRRRPPSRREEARLAGDLGYDARLASHPERGEGTTQTFRTYIAGEWVEPGHAAFSGGDRPALSPSACGAPRRKLGDLVAVSTMSPVGGYKRSGPGRENGVAAMREQPRTNSVRIGTDPEVPNPFVLR